MNAKNHEIVLDHGQTCVIQKTVRMGNLENGGKGHVELRTAEGKNVVNKVTMEKNR